MTLHSRDVGSKSLDMGVVADHDWTRQTAVDDDMRTVRGFVNLEHFGAEHDHSVLGADIVAQQPVNLALAVNIDAPRRLFQSSSRGAQFSAWAIATFC